MNQWIRFFFGAPRRFLVSAIAIVVLAAIVYLRPGLVFGAVDRLACELWPAIQAFLVFVVVVYGFRLIVFGRGGGSRRR